MAHMESHVAKKNKKINVTCKQHLKDALFKPRIRVVYVLFKCEKCMINWQHKQRVISDIDFTYF